MLLLLVVVVVVVVVGAGRTVAPGLVRRYWLLGTGVCAAC